jgi:hypothetical protein
MWTHSVTTSAEAQDASVTPALLYVRLWLACLVSDHVPGAAETISPGSSQQRIFISHLSNTSSDRNACIL